MNMINPVVPARTFRFTLRQLFGATTAVCVSVAAMCWFAPYPAIAALFLSILLGVAVFFAFIGNFEAASAATTAAIAVFLFFPMTYQGLGPSRRSICRMHLRQISLALEQYQDFYGYLPPPYIADANGKLLHSWRVLLLPFLEQQDLYDTYRFDEPWDGPNNRKLHRITQSLFSCASRSEKQPKTDTSYVAVVGSETAWPTGANRRFLIGDGLSNTILLVEVANSGIHWMEPRDLDFNKMQMVINPPKGLGISSHHHDGAQVAFADGRVQFLQTGIPSETLRAALTRNGKDNDRLGPLFDSR